MHCEQKGSHFESFSVRQVCVIEVEEDRLGAPILAVGRSASSARRQRTAKSD